MIKKLKKIDKFGIFNNFDWDKSVRDKGNNVCLFKKMNVIYGRNYSGKTSLSRIFGSLENKTLPAKYTNSSFLLEGDFGQIDQKSLSQHTLDVRVYNKDFVLSNLTFLSNDQEEIESFAILGEKNTEIERQIAEKEKLLGYENLKFGFKYDSSNKKEIHNQKKKEYESLKKGLEDKLTKKANQDIKRNTLYNAVNYNINSIQSDITKINNEGSKSFSQEEIAEKTKIANEQPKSDVLDFQLISFNIKPMLDITNDLLKKKVSPTETINELLHDSSLQEWVRQGIHHHKDKRKNCAFCNNPLKEELWGKLSAHFNRDSEELRSVIANYSVSVENKSKEPNKILKHEFGEFYSFLDRKFVKVKNEFEIEIRLYLKNLEEMTKSLNKRKNDIFNSLPPLQFVDNSRKLNFLQLKMKALIRKNNAKTKDLNSEKDKARLDLRLHEISKFLDDISYKDELKKIEEANKSVQTAIQDYDLASAIVKEKEEEIDSLKVQPKDEKKGAEKVNEYLRHYFGHEGIELIAVEREGTSGYRFQINRGGTIAHNLSEGECSLVAFCYFMAKLEDIETKGKKIIIWLDDPISSLDNNHIFFVFSLIEKVIAKPTRGIDGSNIYNYMQLFISTHNLDFLKCLKRLSHPKDDIEYFILDRIAKNSEIKVMPEYFKRYTTEFNYLFHQIYKCSKMSHLSVDSDCLYNFGNNLRKFLEAYLFYRYPRNANIIVKLKKFFKDDLATDLTNRISNEFSHLEEIFDRSMKPIEIPEIPTVAKYVLDKIKEKDQEQYDALLESVGEVT
ncbi:AAA family ATPase [Leptospira santarosai]|uniref:AAA domain protein n=1 Tax=Leptospira santarosai serovar Arenal str. MAVJ 401 TaxID=1049976 RepID=M6JMJ7_9LEPT|nr:AAA family ATPase [Leptospira santarosai]EMN23084.1 AAA domain protein [Leptospira santarosai serovar Arenal str. MAVJ 401]